MMSEAVKSILLMSAAGGTLALFLLCIKPITRKYFSPKWQYYIWLTVLIVLVLPIRFSMPAKQVDIPPVNTAVQTGQNVIIQENGKNLRPPVLNKLSEKPTIKIPEVPINIVHILGFIWLAAALSILGYKLLKYAIFLRAIHKNSISCTMENIPHGLAVRKTDLLDAPCIVGLIKPVLYLPQGEIKQEELAYILLHELTHYKRHDILYKWFAMLVASVHWFNPFVYIVSKQIDEECEVSCDDTVCKNLTEPQKNSYMEMILDFVGASIRQKRPLTTQMAGSKKTLTRRFIMIKNKKQTSKIMSILSALAAVLLLSTTIFASSILTDMATDDYRIEIINGGKKIELVNKPFFNEGELYIPLRETLENLGFNENNSLINWDDGTVTVAITQNNGVSGIFKMKIGSGSIDMKHIDNIRSIDMNNGSGITTRMSFHTVPILKNSVTHIPLNNINYIVYGFFGMGTSNELTYNVYDRNNNDVTDEADILTNDIKAAKKMQTPTGTAELFFKSFNKSNFEEMKKYCTQSCVDTFFGNGFVFGMKKASVTSMGISQEEYLKSSNDFNIMVSVNMTPDENSVFEPSQTSTSFYICLIRQPDGRYLINRFATGL